MRQLELSLSLFCGTRCLPEATVGAPTREQPPAAERHAVGSGVTRSPPRQRPQPQLRLQVSPETSRGPQRQHQKEQGQGPCRNRPGAPRPRSPPPATPTVTAQAPGCSGQLSAGRAQDLSATHQNLWLRAREVGGTKACVPLPPTKQPQLQGTPNGSTAGAAGTSNSPSCAQGSGHVACAVAPTPWPSRPHCHSPSMPQGLVVTGVF